MKKSYLFSIILLSAFSAGFALFKISAPKTCEIVSENIFVLTGDARRIPYGYKLLRDRKNFRLHIIGVGANRATDIAPEDLLPQIEIESQSKTTYQNATAVAEIARASDMKSIVLLTTEDHMPRALLLVRRALPEAEVAACPVPLHNMPATKRLERWGYEYLKYMGSLLGLKKR
jgi:uncharacterized SAM-binding protein YcdF (DUF218 family)